jgi:glycosyltransferase involved in cell wall biosynthesis
LPRGPAYARNRGFEVSRGEIVLFIDADVVVKPDTLRRMVELFDARPAISAAFGSYDAHPAAPGIVSQYRNLLHHYVHQQSAGEADTFWGGCGAVRSSAFREIGMFNEWHFARPQIEDIEFGQRLHATGHKILLAPEIQVTHLKRWTLRNVIATDFRDRGVPWMRLLVHQRQALRPGSLNLRSLEKLNTLLVWASLLSVIIGFSPNTTQRWVVAGELLIVPVFVLNWHLYAFFARVRGVFFTLAVIPLHLLYYLVNGVSAGFGWLVHLMVGEPWRDATTEAYHEVGVRTWPPVPAKRGFGAEART